MSEASNRTQRLVAASDNPVTHEAIMDELRAVRHAGERARTSINRRLDAGSTRFDALERRAAEQSDQLGKLELAVKPLTTVIKGVGSEEDFEKLAVGALKGLYALAWLGEKSSAVAKWFTVVVGGLAAFGLVVKYVFLDFWRGL